MNFFDADGTLKIGNVELKFLVDFEKNGDAIMWKTAKYNGFMFTKNILGAHVYQQAVRVMTIGGSVDINCNDDDTAREVLNIILNICVRLYTGKKLGTYNLEKIGEGMTKTKGSCCGECTCDENKDEDTEDFIKFMDGFFEHMKNKLKENK